MFKNARSTAIRLAQQFATDYPLSMQTLGGRKSQDIYQKALLNLKSQAQTAQFDNHFGILSRIVLARGFQSALAGMQYSGTVQRQATSELASAITFATK